jgi:enoyl-CoA hydratase/carnithine racemase
MKMTKILLLGTVGATALLTNQNIRAADFSSSDLANRAVAASPRALEQFPELARQSSARTEVLPLTGGVVATVKKNRALAASPRMREQFPELARGEQPATAASEKIGSGVNPLAEVARNAALARTPRMLEQFPELARSYPAQPTKESVAVAPLK